MALRNQPYLPLYVDDFMVDEKLRECSAESTGVYIRIMCLMHKSEEYGVVLLKQKDKQNQSTYLNFANKLAMHLPYAVDVIERSLKELVLNGVIQMDEDKILQKRMIKDFHISDLRAKAGKTGGDKSALGRGFAQANTEANSENENINGNNRDRESAERERESKKPNQKQVDELFEKVWSFYPVKKGKASVSAKQKRVLYEIGYDELKRCFDRYVSGKEKWKEYQQGSTFFNSGYVDYLDINYGQPSFQQPTIEVNSGPQVPNYRSED